LFRKSKRQKMIGIATIILGVLILIKGSLQSLLHIRFTTGDLLMLIASFSSSYTILVRLKPGATSQSLSVQYFCFRVLFSSGLSLGPLLSALFLTLLFLLPHVGIFASLVSYYLWNEAITHWHAKRP
jgi:drug/metabolite transporter (DMT)-like permease